MSPFDEKKNGNANPTNSPYFEENITELPYLDNKCLHVANKL
jgi:hypothetical protein